ncbi:MAG: ABC transporter permease, partial [Dongiaceae bacterium]
MPLKRTLILIAPSALIIGVFMLIPMFIAVAYSFMTANPYGGVTPPATLDAYIQFLYQRDFDDSLVFSTDYIFIILRSVYLAVATTVICLVLGLPIAWYIVCQSEDRRRLLLFFVTLPFWINTLIRTYCWILI